VEYTTLGKTGRRVSRIGFGGATAGLKNYVHSFDPDKKEDREPIVNGLRRALELGINYFDTAIAYGDGKSEQIFGEGLQDADPKEIFLATKARIADASATRSSIEQSLKNLRREWIDLLQVHGTNYTEDHVKTVMGPGGMLDELEKIKSEGLVKHIGFTIEAQNEAIYRFIKCGRFDTMQISYNFIFQHPYDPSWKCGSLYDAETQKLGIVVMRTVTSGIFQRWVQMVNPANTFNYSPALVQFILSNPLVDVALLGMRSVARVEENVAICEDTSGRIDLDALHKRYV
jgi:predicted aldo/keto reductase-like oxidoreductase